MLYCISLCIALYPTPLFVGRGYHMHVSLNQSIATPSRPTDRHYGTNYIFAYLAIEYWIASIAPINIQHNSQSQTFPPTKRQQKLSLNAISTHSQTCITLSGTTSPWYAACKPKELVSFANFYIFARTEGNPACFAWISSYGASTRWRPRQSRARQNKCNKQRSPTR